MNVNWLAGLLHAAPNMASLALWHSGNEPCFVQLAYSESDACDLVDQYIDEGTVLFTGSTQREVGGICVSSKPGLIFYGEEVWFDMLLYEHEHSMCCCMDTYMDMPLFGYSATEFTNDCANGKERRCLTHLSRVFPDVEFLSVRNIDLGSQDMVSLASCRSLRDLGLATVGSVCTRDLRTLCRNSNSLESVRLFDCGGVCLTSRLEIERRGGKLHKVEVSIVRERVLASFYRR